MNKKQTDQKFEVFYACRSILGDADAGSVAIWMPQMMQAYKLGLESKLEDGLLSMPHQWEEIGGDEETEHVGVESVQWFCLECGATRTVVWPAKPSVDEVCKTVPRVDLVTQLQVARASARGQEKLADDLRSQLVKRIKERNRARANLEGLLAAMELADGDGFEIDAEDIETTCDAIRRDLEDEP